VNNKKCGITECLNITVSYCRMTRDVHFHLKTQKMKIRVAIKPIHIYFTRKRSIQTIEILIFCRNVNWDCCKDYILTIWRRYSFCLTEPSYDDTGGDNYQNIHLFGICCVLYTCKYDYCIFTHTVYDKTVIKTLYHTVLWIPGV